MKVKGYLTIEAALVFPVILSIVMIMMGLSFYVYNRVIVKECINEALVLGAREDIENRETYMRERVSKTLNENGVALEVTDIKTHAGITKVKIRVEGRVNVLWITSIEMPIKIEEELKIWRTINDMRLISVGKKLLNQEDKFKNELE